MTEITTTDAIDNSFISFDNDITTTTTTIQDKDLLNLNNLVHLALSSSPQLGGIVNFNILKTFLLELLKALNLQNYELKLSNDLKQQQQHASQLQQQQPVVISQERFHVLEDKINRFEQQISALNSLPSNQNIIEKSKDLKRFSSPVLEIWQYTQISKRLESNEEGITKLTSLLQDLINEINDLKESHNKHEFNFNNLSNQFNDLMNRFLQIEKFKDTLVNIFHFIYIYVQFKTFKI